MGCIVTLERCKAPSSVKTWGFNWTAYFTRVWEPGMGFAPGVAVRPNSRPGTGYEYLSSGGVSRGATPRRPLAKVEPLWPEGSDAIATVTDGSIVWTRQAISFESLEERIASDNWEVPSGLTGDPQPFVDSAGLQASAIRLGGGVVGQIYDVRVDVTTTIGNVHTGIIRLTIE